MPAYASVLCGYFKILTPYASVLCGYFKILTPYTSVLCGYFKILTPENRLILSNTPSQQKMQTATEKYLLHSRTVPLELNALIDHFTD